MVSTETKTKKRIKGIMDNVNCAGSESSLWHCNAKHHKTSFDCDDNAYVVCEGEIWQLSYGGSLFLLFVITIMAFEI